MIRGACYVRVSTENQLENYSIEEQTTRLKAFCAAKDITVAHLYTDGGYSGGNTHRPALQQMLSDIEKKQIDTVIVYKLDRLSRSQKDTLTLIEDSFLANGVDFISVSENFDTSTPFGRAMIGILSVFAQLEKDQITERFTMGRIGRAKNGYFHGGAYAPTGYDYVDGKLVVNEYEAMQVRELYNRFASGHTLHDCWQYMSGKYTTKYGAWKSETLVRNVLRNEIYLGKVKFNGVTYPGNHTPIISEDLFQAVQGIFHGSRREAAAFQRSPFRASTLLSSLIYCARCGARFHGEHGNYSCYSRTKGDKKYVIDPSCKNKKWKIEDLDALVIDYIAKLDFSKLEQPQRSQPQAAPDFSVRLKEIDRQVGRLIDLYQVGGIPLESISSKINALSREREALEAQAAHTDTGLTIEDLKAARERFMEILITGDLQEKRYCLTMLVEKILVDGESVNIMLRQS